MEKAVCACKVSDSHVWMLHLCDASVTSLFLLAVTLVTGVSKHPAAQRTLVGTAREHAQGDLAGQTGETDSEVEEGDN